VERQEEKAARSKNPSHFRKDSYMIGTGNVNDGIKGDNTGPSRVSSIQCKHVALLELNVWIQLTGPFDQLG
jgi:hypothetical protein